MVHFGIINATIVHCLTHPQHNQQYHRSHQRTLSVTSLDDHNRNNSVCVVDII